MPRDIFAAELRLEIPIRSERSRRRCSGRLTDQPSMVHGNGPEIDNDAVGRSSAPGWVRSDVLADELPVAARIVPSTERTMRVDLFDLNEIG